MREYGLITALMALANPVGVAVAQELSDMAGASRFVVLLGADTLAVEDFVWGDGVLEGELRDRTTGKRFRYAIAFGDDLVPTAFDADMFDLSAGADAGAEITSSMEFEGDSVFAEVIGAPTPEFQRIGTQVGAVPFLNLSFAIVEYATRLRRLEGGDGDVPFFLWANGETVVGSIAFGGTDSATLTIGGVVLELSVDDAGRMSGGAVPAQNLTIVRVD